MDSTGNKANMPIDSRSNATGVTIALLRGINVGGKNRMPMKELSALFVDAGCDDVRTYIQSGNVVFRTGPAVGEEISATISASILSRFDYRVPVIIRTAREFQEIVRANPFVEAGAEADKLHVMFLAELPDGANVEALDTDRSPGDEFAVMGREIYLHCPNGVARSKLTNSYFDTRLATISTTRNWRTTLKLLELATGAG